MAHDPDVDMLPGPTPPMAHDPDVDMLPGPTPPMAHDPDVDMLPGPTPQWLTLQMWTCCRVQPPNGPGRV